MTRGRFIAPPERDTWRSLADNRSALDIQAFSCCIGGSDAALEETLSMRMFVLDL